nr:hypothetical protein Itr_chr10CG14950 [Ipomoea trifida]GLL46486.1 hypothetical protein Itr_chr14CG11700 [Ipomoea trifida]
MKLFTAATIVPSHSLHHRHLCHLFHQNFHSLPPVLPESERCLRNHGYKIHQATGHLCRRFGGERSWPAAVSSDASGLAWNGIGL